MTPGVAGPIDDKVWREDIADILAQHEKAAGKPHMPPGLRFASKRDATRLIAALDRIVELEAECAALRSLAQAGDHNAVREAALEEAAVEATRLFADPAWNAFVRATAQTVASGIRALKVREVPAGDRNAALGPTPPPTEAPS